ncbi:hypothetical protein [Runella salmonicolor]|uniref:Lipoprotein n=1 Tax=Runella salmonicolor TaxID=2950278 RepID=A0ABT1FQH6_9BACT|nr:hypothetical protein [Runella salmonicolor]MCP1382757.1 hypothetical protein [Runella salmonicolor]
MKQSFTAIFVYLLLFTFCFIGCKSAKKAFKRGDYDESVLRAAEKLRDSPTNSSAGEILKQAYPLALQQNLDDVARYQNAPEAFHFEPVVDAYVRLNRLYDALRKCPACERLVTVRSFIAEERDAREKAASERYEAGMLSMQNKENRQMARQAYEHFESANALLGGFKNVQSMLDESYEYASFKVVVEQVLVTSRAYQLSNEYFQNKVNEFLQTNKRLNKFVRFYSPQEASSTRLKPDHVIKLEFDDFVVGQTLIQSNTDVVTSKDSVKVGETTVNGKKIPVYNKVTAKLTRTRKSVLSSGLLDMQVMDFRNKSVVTQEKFRGDFTWVCEWANFNGDERALTAEQKRLCSVREINPPPPQQLFIEFSKPIYDRLTSKIRDYYKNY